MWAGCSMATRHDVVCHNVPGHSPEDDHQFQCLDQRLWEEWSVANGLWSFQKDASRGSDSRCHYLHECHQCLWEGHAMQAAGVLMWGYVPAAFGIHGRSLALGFLYHEMTGMPGHGANQLFGIQRIKVQLEKSTCLRSQGANAESSWMFLEWTGKGWTAHDLWHVTCCSKCLYLLGVICRNPLRYYTACHMVRSLSMEAKGLLILQRGMPTQLQNTENHGDRRSHHHMRSPCFISFGLATSQTKPKGNAIPRTHVTLV